MKQTIALPALLVACHASAAELNVSLLDHRTEARSAYSFDISTQTVRDIPEAKGQLLPEISDYTSKDGLLLLGGKNLADADEVLYQARLEGLDIVVVRDEYNSLSNPLRILAAFVGHPIQVSKIILLAVSNGRIVFDKQLEKEPASYKWTAQVYK